MCCHPYDHCGPVYQCGGFACCGPYARAGSVLAPGSQPVSHRAASDRIESKQPTKQPTKAETPASARRPSAPIQSQRPTVADRQLIGEARPGDVPGSERIVSVTDQAVGPSLAPAVSSTTPAVSSPTVTASTATPAETLPGGGWTARRISSTVDR
ncbi:MAG: hypothetical protein ABFC96_09350 [Thermoguttaceae bacterium]